MPDAQAQLATDNLIIWTTLAECLVAHTRRAVYVGRVVHDTVTGKWNWEMAGGGLRPYPTGDCASKEDAQDACESAYLHLKQVNVPK